MPGSLHWTSLHDGPLVRVGDVRCGNRDTHRGGEESSSRHSIAFPRRGVFVKHVRGRDVVADANHALLFQRGELYRVSHPLGGGDESTVLHFREDVLVEAFREHRPIVDDAPDRPFPWTHVPTSSRLMLLVRQLRRGSLAFAPSLSVEPLANTRGSPHEKLSGHDACRMATPSPERGMDPLQVDELAMALLSRLIGEGPWEPKTRRLAARASTERAHRDWAFHAQEILNRRYREPASLDQLARAVHCSPYHLARVFRRETGRTIHAYLVQLRLREALERIDRATDLTQLALSLGFASHSHFTDAFRRSFGVAPSSLRC